MTEVADGNAHRGTGAPIVTFAVAPMVTFTFVFATMFVKMAAVIRKAMSGEVAAEKSVAEARCHATVIATMHPATMAAATRTGIDLR